MMHERRFFMIGRVRPVLPSPGDKRLGDALLTAGPGAFLADFPKVVRHFHVSSIVLRFSLLAH